jgi:hypothetical protein
MNIAKNILRAFKNEEMASLDIQFCSVDNEFTAVLSFANEDGTTIYSETDENLDTAIGFIANKVYELKGAI